MSTSIEDPVALQRAEYGRLVAERKSNAGHRAARLHFTLARDSANHLDKAPTRRELIEGGGKPKPLQLDMEAIVACLQECDALTKDGDVRFLMEGDQHSLVAWRSALAELVEQLRQFAESSPHE